MIEMKEKERGSVPIHIIKEELERLKLLYEEGRWKADEYIKWKIGLCESMVKAGERYVKDN